MRFDKLTAKMWAGMLLGVLVLAGGCSAAPSQNNAGNVAGAEVALAPAVVEPASAAPVTDWTQVVTAEGDYFVLGNPAAPVRLVDFSHFF